MTPERALELHSRRLRLVAATFDLAKGELEDLARFALLLGAGFIISAVCNIDTVQIASNLYLRTETRQAGSCASSCRAASAAAAEEKTPKRVGPLPDISAPAAPSSRNRPLISASCG